MKIEILYIPMSTPCHQDVSIPGEQFLSYTVIQNYSPNSELELKDALKQDYDVIVLSDISLGQKVCKWIQFGNILHKSAVVSGTTCVVLNLATQTPDWFTTCMSLCSILSITLYNAMWRRDTVSRYQLDTRGDFVSQMPLSSVRSRSLMVLMKRDDCYRRILHNLIGCIVVLHLGLKLKLY